jgi:hypothetical protein
VNKAMGRPATLCCGSAPLVTAGRLTSKRVHSTFSNVTYSSGFNLALSAALQSHLDYYFLDLPFFVYKESSTLLYCSTKGKLPLNSTHWDVLSRLNLH